MQSSRNDVASKSRQTKEEVGAGSISAVVAVVSGTEP